MIFFRRRRIRELDERVREACSEREHSERRLDKVRSEVVAPATRRIERNQFAELIRRSLLIDGGRR